MKGDVIWIFVVVLDVRCGSIDDYRDEKFSCGNIIDFVV